MCRYSIVLKIMKISISDFFTINEINLPMKDLIFLLNSLVLIGKNNKSRICIPIKSFKNKLKIDYSVYLVIFYF